MNAVLSVQGSAVSEKTKPSFMSRVFNKKKALKVAKVALPVAAVAAFFPDAAMATTTATDLMKSGERKSSPAVLGAGCGAHDGEAVAAYRLQRGLRAAEDPIRRDGPGCGHCAAEGRTAYPGRTGHSPGHPAA